MRSAQKRFIISFIVFMMITPCLAFAGEHSVFMYGFGHGHGGWLGISIEDISPKLAKSKNLKGDNGAYVNSVKENSPADSAGIKEGDVITKFDGKEIDGADDLVRAVEKTKPGVSVAIELLRKGEAKTIQVTVGKYPRRFVQNQFRIPPMPRIQMYQMREVFGLRLHELDEQLGKYFEAPDGKGLLVEHVTDGSSGEKAGFKAGDVIIKVGKESVGDMEDLSDAVEDIKDGDKIPVEIVRRGTTQTLTVETNDDDDSSFNFQFETEPEPMISPDIDIESSQLDLREMRHSLENFEQEMKALQQKEITIPKEIEKELHDRLQQPAEYQII